MNNPAALRWRDPHSFGMVCFELFAEGKPFLGLNNTESNLPGQLRFRVLNNHRSTLQQERHAPPPAVAALMERYWNADPAQRPRTDEIVAAFGALRRAFPIGGGPVPVRRLLSSDG
ncbi:unnamed protein product [Phaeothamnion confervicola]